MKISLPAVMLIFFGVLLIYSARMERDPRNVVFEALGIKRRVPEPAKVGRNLGKAAGETANDVIPLLPPISKPPSGTGPIVSV